MVLVEVMETASVILICFPYRIFCLASAPSVLRDNCFRHLKNKSSITTQNILTLESFWAISHLLQCNKEDKWDSSMFQYKWSFFKMKRLTSKIQYFNIWEIFRIVSDHKFSSKNLTKYVGVFQMQLLPN